MRRAEKSKESHLPEAERIRESWQERQKRIKHKWAVLFVFVEWNCERLSRLLERWALLDILERLGRLGILVSIVAGAYVYVTEADERRMQVENQQKVREYQAWQVINTARGNPGDGGRVRALHDLHRDHISLAGVDISEAHLLLLDLEGANLTRANLAAARLIGASLDRADLTGANLEEADLTGPTFVEANLKSANLTQAVLRFADLAGASLRDANLTKADLEEANLTQAVLSHADLTGADLMEANLTGADLGFADLTEAQLFEANLTGADLSYADLTEANLVGANLSNIVNWQDIRSIRLANIYDVKNPPEGFREWMKIAGAVEIESPGEWRARIREKMEEKKKQEADNSRGDKKKVR